MGSEIEPAVMPVILLPAHFAIEMLPSFLAEISMLPWGSTVAGFFIGEIEKVMPYARSASTTLVIVTTIMEEVEESEHCMLDEAF